MCYSCHQCPSCCRSSSSCRSKTSPILVNLGVPRGLPQDSTIAQRRVHFALSQEAKFDEVTHHPERLCTCPQARLPVGGITCAQGEKCHRVGHKPSISSVFQPSLFGSKTQPKMATHFGPEHPKQVSQGRQIQNGDPREYKDIFTTRGMGDVHRLQGRLFPRPHSPSVQKVPEISCPRKILPVQGTPFRTFHSPSRVHQCSKGGETNGSEQGYKDPPVPRRLVGQGQVPPYLSPTYPRSGGFVPSTRLGSEHGQIGIGSHANLRFRRLPIRSEIRQSSTHCRPVAGSQAQGTLFVGIPSLFSQATDVSHRPPDSYRETGPSRATTYETYPVAFKTTLENPRIPQQGDSCSPLLAPTPEMVAQGGQCPFGTTIAPPRSLPTDLHRCFTGGLGGPSGRPDRSRVLVRPREQVAHQLSGTESSFSSPQTVPVAVQRQDGVDSNGQYHGRCLYQQRRGHEVRTSVCPPVEDPVLVLSESGLYQSQAHPWPSECGSRQAFQAWSGYPNRMVSYARSFSGNMSGVAPTPSGPICHSVQQQTSPVCISGPGPRGHGGRCPESQLGRPGPIRISPHSTSRQGGGETQRSPVQADHSDRARVAPDALVLGSGGHVQPDPTVPSSSSQSAHPAVQPDSSQKSGEPQSACLAPRATAIKEQGFSEAVAARIEAPQRLSTRKVYEAKWSIFTKWCLSHQVDVRAPSLRDVADFLLHLFQERKFQPSTIDGYRSAISDKLGTTRINVGKDENLTRLVESFHRDRPKGKRGIPSWNLSLVLHQLTQAPFEPLKEASLKHLTFKTVFLLALASGKRRSEIHAWVFKNIRHQADWLKVSLYPSPSFLSKNQLAKEGSNSVAPVVIPALAPTLDRTLKEDRSLCPVRALRYYLDKTSTCRQGKELVFVSMKKGSEKDISPATISSWIKQTVILCYELADKDAHSLYRVKAHDVRALAASTAFQSGVSLEQLLSACHWKSHNTFTQFYLKDVAWADAELYHLGPVVAAQQIHHPNK